MREDSKFLKLQLRIIITTLAFVIGVPLALSNRAVGLALLTVLMVVVGWWAYSKLVSPWTRWVPPKGLTYQRRDPELSALFERSGPPAGGREFEHVITGDIAGRRWTAFQAPFGGEWYFVVPLAGQVPHYVMEPLLTRSATDGPDLTYRYNYSPRLPERVKHIMATAPVMHWFTQGDLLFYRADTMTPRLLPTFLNQNAPTLVKIARILEEASGHGEPHAQPALPPSDPARNTWVPGAGLGRTAEEEPVWQNPPRERG